MRDTGTTSRLLSVLLPFLVFASAAPARAAGETIGSVKSVNGAAALLRDGERLPVRAGLRLIQGDALETGPTGSLGLILRDDSLLSLGPSSTVAMEKFQFLPAERKLGMTVRIVRGTMAFLTGLIGHLAPESAIFVTPVATIGVRGTLFAVRVAD